MRIEKGKYNFIFCSFYPVGLDDYVDYFRDRFGSFYYLRWKFPHSKDKKAYSSLQIIKDGKKVEKKLISFSAIRRGFLYFSLLPLNYLIYFFQAITLLAKRINDKPTIFMGINYFCTFCGIILKKIGSVDFVIYRVMDFFPLPKTGPYMLLNRVFYVIDKFCLENCDSIWFTTEKHILGREKYGYFDRKKHKYQMVPLGINLKEFYSLPLSKINKYSLVYCGVLSRYHRLDLMFEVVKRLSDKFKNIKLHVIGSGPDIDFFKTLSRQMALEDRVIFHGFMENSKEFRELMASNVLGVALYHDEEDFIKYTEPAKVKFYLSFGVPAVVSDVPATARQLEKEKVCFVVSNKVGEICEKIEKFILDTKKQREYKKNIRRYVKTIDIYKILDRSFENTEFFL